MVIEGMAERESAVGRLQRKWATLLNMLQYPRMQGDEPKAFDLSDLLDRSHENKWVAFAPDYSEVVAASESLLDLDKLVAGKTSFVIAHSPTMRSLLPHPSRVKYKYAIVSGAQTVAGRFVKRPVVQIEMSRGKQTRTFLAIIDSGADNIILPAYIVDLFGIDKSATSWASRSKAHRELSPARLPPAKPFGNVHRARCLH
jgi:hypothetical protein